MHKHEDAAALCVEAGANVSIQRTPELNTALHEACHLKMSKVAKLLISKRSTTTTQGVDNHEWDMLEAKNQFGNTPLHSAAAAGSLECVKMLLDAGAKVKTPNHASSFPST